jgi:hypothetical protein
LQFAIFQLRRKIIADFPQRAIHKTVVFNAVKSQRSVKHIWFLPTHKANAKKPNELALSHRT